jgi:hypothetical protein
MNEENLVGPRSDERNNVPRETYELYSTNGDPLWMSLIPEDTLVYRPEDVHAAKNKLMEIDKEHHDVIELCSSKTTNECREMLAEFNNLAQTG